MRPWMVLGLGALIGAGGAAQGSAQPDKDKKAEGAPQALAEPLRKADIVVVGKVTEVGLSAASSFDVGAIEVREVLQGKADTKAVKFRFASSGGGKVAPYGKKGVEGVWILGKEGGYMGAREVLAYRPLAELPAIRKLIGQKPKEPPPEDSKK